MNTPIKTQATFTASIILAASFFALGCAAMSGRAQAAETAQVTKTRIVHYGDLNLDSEQGAKTLYARIRSAAENVCFSLESRDYTHKKLWQGCFDQAVASAVVQVNKARVTALHNQTISHAVKG